MASSARSTSGYRTTLGPWDHAEVSVKLPKDRYEDGRVIVGAPEMTMNDEPYIVTTEMRPRQARALAKQLTRAANMIDPPKPRKARA